MANFPLRVIDVSLSGTTPTPGGGFASASVALMTRKEAEGSKSILTAPFFERFVATHTHVGDGRYDATTPPAPGEWLLVVRASGKSPVVQRLTIAETAGVTLVTAGWKGSGEPQRDLQAAAVDIVNLTTGKSTAKPTPGSAVTVKLFPMREFVFLSGTEYHGAGTTWRLFSEGRRNILRQANLITDGDWVTLLVCEQRARRTFVKAVGGAGAWLVIDEFLKSSTPRTSSNQKVQPVEPREDIGILDLYAYLSARGNEAPGSVQEASVFSHAYYDGPILWDTFQRDPVTRIDYTHRTRRFDGDLDGRTKDWNSIAPDRVMLSYPGLSGCFAASAFFKTWGCNAERYIGQMIRQCESKLGPKPVDDAFFEFIFTEEEPSIDVSALNIRDSLTLAHLRKFEIEHRLRVYDGEASKFLGRKVFGAPPGAGSSFGASGANNVMFVNEKENAPIYAFFNRELRALPAKDEQGYYDFQALLSASTFPPPKWSTQRYRIEAAQSKDPAKAITELRVASGAYASRPGADGSFRVEPKSDLVDAGKSGHLFVALAGDFAQIGTKYGEPSAGIVASTTRDAGVYMQDDGTVYLLTRRRGATVWVKHAGPIPHYSGVPVTNGVLQPGAPVSTW